MDKSPSTSRKAATALFCRIRTAKLSRAELLASCLFWLCIPGATAILATYLGYKASR